MSRNALESVRFPATKDLNRTLASGGYLADFLDLILRPVNAYARPLTRLCSDIRELKAIQLGHRRRGEFRHGPFVGRDDEHSQPRFESKKLNAR
jgi:hypothetical protein